MSKKLVEVSSLRVGGYVIVDDIACRVTDIQTSRPGKHGHAKSRIEAVGLVNSVKKIIIRPGHDKIEVPIVEKKGAQVLSIHEDIANVMDSETYETFDMDIPEELKGEVTEGKEVLYWTIMGAKVMKQVKN